MEDRYRARAIHTLYIDGSGQLISESFLDKYINEGDTGWYYPDEQLFIRDDGYECNLDVIDLEKIPNRR